MNSRNCMCRCMLPTFFTRASQLVQWRLISSCNFFNYWHLTHVIIFRLLIAANVYYSMSMTISFIIPFDIELSISGSATYADCSAQIILQVCVYVLRTAQQNFLVVLEGYCLWNESHVLFIRYTLLFQPDHPEKFLKSSSSPTHQSSCFWLLNDYGIPWNIGQSLISINARLKTWQQAIIMWSMQIAIQRRRKAFESDSPNGVLSRLTIGCACIVSEPVFSN